MGRESFFLHCIFTDNMYLVLSVLRDLHRMQPIIQWELCYICWWLRQKLLSQKQNEYKDMYSVTENTSVCIICEVLSKTPTWLGQHDKAPQMDEEAHY